MQLYYSLPDFFDLGLDPTGAHADLARISTEVFTVEENGYPLAYGGVMQPNFLGNDRVLWLVVIPEKLSRAKVLLGLRLARQYLESLGAPLWAEVAHGDMRGKRFLEHLSFTFHTRFDDRDLYHWGV